MESAMANCAKCSAELITTTAGSGASPKYCAACGAPVVQQATSEPKPSAGGGPVSQVNPFAATASPISRAAEPASQQATEQALAKAPTSVAPPAPPARPYKAGTQVMPRMPSRPISKPDEAPTSQEATAAPTPATPKKVPPRTVAMNFAAMQRALQADALPAQPAQPAGPRPGGDAGQPPMAPPGYPYNAAPAPSQPPPAHMGQGGWGWGPGFAPQPHAAEVGFRPTPQYAATPAPQPPMVQYPFGYGPGARVQVTWSNGQRYPAIVSQVSGTQCLVVFPDGQQHWVDMHYLSLS